MICSNNYPTTTATFNLSTFDQSPEYFYDTNLSPLFTSTTHNRGQDISQELSTYPFGFLFENFYPTSGHDEARTKGQGQTLSLNEESLGSSKSPISKDLQNFYNSVEPDLSSRSSSSDENSHEGSPEIWAQAQHASLGQFHVSNTTSTRVDCCQHSNHKTRTRTDDKYRVVYSDYQRIELEREFQANRYITLSTKSQLAFGLGLTERQIKIWFQNRRAKERRMRMKYGRLGGWDWFTYKMS